MKEECIQASKEVSSTEGRKDATKQATKQTNKHAGKHDRKNGERVWNEDMEGYGNKGTKFRHNQKMDKGNKIEKHRLFQTSPLQHRHFS